MYRGVWLIDGFWNWWLDLLTHYTQHSELHVITALSLNSEIYNSLLQTLVSSVCYISTIRFLATDFNTGTIKVSLNHTLHISLYYSTCKIFSSLPDFQLSTALARLLHHPPTANSRTLNPILCCNCHVFSLLFAELNSWLPSPETLSILLTTTNSLSKSKSKLCYDRRSVGQSVLE
jgi:hypothetical protein